MPWCSFFGIHTDSCAAGVSVFDDHTGGAVKAADGFPGSVAVGDVVVGKFFAVQLVVAGQKSRCNISFTIEGGFLVRIFAVTHVLHLDPLTSQAFRELRTCRDVVAFMLVR